MLDVTCVASARKAQALIVPVRPGAIPEKFRRAANADGFTGAPDTVCEILDRRKTVLVGMGDPLSAGARATARLLRYQNIALDAKGLTPKEAADMAAGACLRAWTFGRLKTRPDEDAPRLQTFDIITDDPRVQKRWARTAQAVEATLFARDLVSEPANTLTPAGFVEHLKKHIVPEGVFLKVLHEPELRAQKFGGILAVGQGSANPPCLAILRWPGEHDTPPVVFVGKGITFDTGGISIKHADKMWEMRADMAGAAACAGAIFALALRKSPCPALAILPLAENTTGAASYRPGDVLKLFSGKTVEIIDTDAEGRLVLADALAYALGEKPLAIIDLATLTGSIVVALGNEMAGSFGNDPSLAASAAASGAAIGENLWRMPITEADRRALDSDIADIKQCSPERMQPDASHAAAFLREFVGETPWLHLDIAGVENFDEANDEHAKGASGFGVRLLDRLIGDRFEDPHRV